MKFEEEAGTRPGLVVVEGYDVGAASGPEMRDMKALAGEIEAELWFSVACTDEQVPGMPAWIAELGDAISVALAMEPETEAVALRALKEHDNPDVEALRVALDPKTLLLVRS